MTNYRNQFLVYKIYKPLYFDRLNTSYSGWFSIEVKVRAKTNPVSLYAHVVRETGLIYFLILFVDK